MFSEGLKPLSSIILLQCSTDVVCVASIERVGDREEGEKGAGYYS